MSTPSTNDAVPLVNVLGFSTAQRVSLAITKSLVGSLSLIGSLLLIWHTSSRLWPRHHHTHRRRSILRRSASSGNNVQQPPQQQPPQQPHNVMRTYLRLLLGMSVLDSLSSLATGTLNTVLVRSNSGGWGAHGTQATCSFSGFFNQLQAAVPLYNASLAIYFWISIWFGLTQGRKILYYLEPLLHAVPWVVGLATATLGTVQGWFNAQVVPEIGCWVEAYPVGCTFMQDMECTRGPTDAETQEDLIIKMSFYPLVGACAAVMIANLLILGIVVTKECRMRRHTFSQRGHGNQQSNRQIRTVAFQNFLYVAVMINTVLWVLLADVAIYVGGLPESFFFPLYYLYCISFPAQGFWNFLVYIRTQYLYLRRRQKLGRRQALWESASLPHGKSHCAIPSFYYSADDAEPNGINHSQPRFSIRSLFLGGSNKSGVSDLDVPPGYSETSRSSHPTIVGVVPPPQQQQLGDSNTTMVSSGTTSNVCEG